MKQIAIYFKKTKLTANELALKFQGFLLSHLPQEDAAFLHQQETNPYSSLVLSRNEHQIWYINLLTDEMCEALKNFLTSLDNIQLDSYEHLIMVEKVEIKSLLSEQLIHLFNEDCDQPTFSIRFITPTSFKSKGEYSIFPTVRFIFQSLMQKYSRLYPDLNTFDESLLDYLAEHAKITSYQLQTHYYSVHKSKIPAFQGRITIKLYGASTLKAFVKMLLTFGEFSGVGVKTSMGMGGVRIEERKN
ncbi:CRISPR-associated endoribonuclease Cas6 [Streptococcus tangpeifui]|uniref:CRISPR-associated endoribonuclease Cas6 n=1 Tax=Streptococcus tangpeifui TaxID=2709400 RepID=UPI0013EADE12|nr:CRISPR-associated endoribonuclease Cas6 [Streptococcus sp. ZJ1593]